MAVGHATYLDLTKEQRQMAAARVREQVRQALANPFLAPEQRAILHSQVDRITRWERGTLAIGAPFVVPAPPKA
jgi:hypothetical protein